MAAASRAMNRSGTRQPFRSRFLLKVKVRKTSRARKKRPTRRMMNEMSNWDISASYRAILALVSCADQLENILARLVPPSTTQHPHSVGNRQMITNECWNDKVFPPFFHVSFVTKADISFPETRPGSQVHLSIPAPRKTESGYPSPETVSLRWAIFYSSRPSRLSRSSFFGKITRFFFLE